MLSSELLFVGISSSLNVSIVLSSVKTHLFNFLSVCQSEENKMLSIIIRKAIISDRLIRFCKYLIRMHAYDTLYISCLHFPQEIHED